MWNNVISVPLPTDGNAVLCCMPGPQVDICYYDTRDGQYHDYFFKQVVEPWFWMPLPAPPTAEEMGSANLQRITGQGMQLPIGDSGPDGFLNDNG